MLRLSAAAFVFAMAAPSLGAPVTITFTGSTYSSVTYNPGAPFYGMPSGASVALSIYLDSAAPDAAGATNFGNYSSGLSGFSLTIGSETFTKTSGFTSSEFFVHDNTTDSISNRFTWGQNSLDWYLYDSSGTTLNSDALPSTIDLADWGFNTGTWRYRPEGAIFSDQILFRFTDASIDAVPIPLASPSLLAAVGLSPLLLGRARRRCIA